MNNSRKPPQTPARILLVDDNHFGNAARKAVLEEHGFQVECALCGEDGLSRCQQTRFDLVVTDLKMTPMSGLEVIAHLRTSAHPPRLILLSGWAVCLGMTEESTGADAVLAKSHQEGEQLVRAVRQLLARGPVRKAPVSAQGGPNADGEQAASKPMKRSVARSG